MASLRSPLSSDNFNLPSPKSVFRSSMASFLPLQSRKCTRITRSYRWQESFTFAVVVSSIVPSNQLTRASHWHARELLLHRSNIARKWMQMARVVVFSRLTSCRPTLRRHRARPRAVRRPPGGCDKYISMHTEVRHTGSVVPSSNASSSPTTRGPSRRFSNSCAFLPSCRTFSSGCGAPIRNACPGPASNPRPDPAPGSIHGSQRMHQEHHD